MRLFQKYTLRTAILSIAILGTFSVINAQEVVEIDSVIWSNRSGLENILQGTSAGLKVESWTGTPGSQSLINLRGLSLDPSDVSSYPLIMVNGVPIIADPSVFTSINPLSYYSPDQIERVEIVKDIVQLAEYGVQAPNGAINIVTKEGTTGPIHVTASTFAGYNFLGDYDYKTDAFYNFNTTARKEIYTGSIIHEENVIIDGGGSYGTYLFGLNNHTDEGIIKDAKYNRQSLFFNAKYNITEKFTTQFYNNFTLARRDGRYAGDLNRSLPLPRVEDEEFFMDKNSNIALLSSIGLAYQLMSGLKLSSLIGISYEGSKRDLYVPSNLQKNNIYALSAAYKRQLISIDTRLDYNTQLSDDIKMDLAIGNEIVSRENRLTNVDGYRSIEAGGSDYVKVVTGYSAAETNAMSGYEIDNLVSFYGIGKFIFKEDLKVNIVLRTDGSSLYKKKWELYPALGFTYNMHNVLNIPVTFNASYGKTGVLNRPENYRGELIAFGDYYGGTELGIGELYQPFDDAKSASVFQLDAGFSYSITNRLSFSAQYFNKTYNDFTYLRYLPNITGLDYQYENGMKLKLSGVELTLTGDIIRTNNFRWTCNLNMAYNNNEVKSLPNDLANTSLSRYAALNEGDEITSLIAYEGQTEKIIGNSEANFFGGLNNTISLGNFSAGAKLTYASGANIVAESFDSRYSVEMAGGEYPVKATETPYYFVKSDDNGNAVFQGITSVENGNFLRLSSAVVSYNFRALAEKSMTISDMQVYMRGENLFTLSKYWGINPEENTEGIREHNLVNTGTFLPASVVLGVKLKF